MSIESVIILVYLIGAGASYKFLARMATERVSEELNNRKGKVVVDEAAYMVFVLAVIVSVALWPIMLPMRLFELARERTGPNPKATSAVATKRAKRRR